MTLWFNDTVHDDRILNYYIEVIFFKINVVAQVRPKRTIFNDQQKHPAYIEPVSAVVLIARYKVHFTRHAVILPIDKILKVIEVLNQLINPV